MSVDAVAAGYFSVIEGSLGPSLASLGTWAGGSFVSGSPRPLSIPADTNAGNLLVAVVACSQLETVTMPSGWTQRITGVAGASSWLQLEVWTKVAAGGDAGSTTTVTLTGTDAKYVSVILDCVGALDAVSTFSTSTTSRNAYTTPSLTVSSGALPIAIVTDRAAGVIPPNDATASSTWTPPANWTISDTHVSGTGQNAGDMSLCIAVGPIAVGTSVGGDTFTAQYTNARGGAAIISIIGGY